MREVYIVDYVRTPFSRSRPKKPEKDVFHKIRGDELAKIVLDRIVEKAGISKEIVERIVMGCAFGVWENWAYGGRGISLLAEYPVETATMITDMQCGSSIASAQTASLEIMAGVCDVAIAGGYEHMTRVPMGMENQHISPNFRLIQDERYKKYEMNIGFVMGLTAERLFQEAKNITKEDLDEWGLRSHRLAYESLKSGYFRGEITPISAEQADGSVIVVESDQSIRGDTTLEQISNLPPVFMPNGVITAGNSSPLNAGASALLLMSAEKVKELGLEPLAKIKAFGYSGVHPAVMGKGPVPASKKAVEKANLKLSDIDYWEINEAFAIVTLYAVHELGIEPERVNVHGGAIAIGHPLGATGARLIGTLARTLREKEADYGVATACIGGGQGIAMVIERV
ncbi:acetyl-CoA acetyltransferase [Archaeoglobus sulfaticallidus PM70-1]|uniref:Acetyl-CoA acetyltransferase n=1 Tax=Archaeoglobus sulfaticallidus PM70-1 TaxID=387631 RepID=N0BA96_9EURY|nr:acetyl-CoA C-acetyltransferase [Archaeoglobus sulfaticallidus]AGK60504.1 acetyl-CoA acetyltransferase [Archaeoglobus sulfaticallidus PM70-1]